MSGDADDDTILLTKAIRAEVRTEHKRTGVSAMLLLSTIEDGLEGLPPGAINRWMSSLSEPRRKAFDFVLAQRRALLDFDGPDQRKSGKVYPLVSSQCMAVTAEVASERRQELARTVVDHAHILDDLKDALEG